MAQPYPHQPGQEAGASHSSAIGASAEPTAADVPHPELVEQWARAVETRDMFEMRDALVTASAVVVNTLIHVSRPPDDGPASIPMTALTHTTIHQCLGAFRLLMRTPAVDPNVRDQHGRTALHWAAARGYTFFACALMEHPLLDMGCTDLHGLTALHVATELPSYPLVVQLVLQPDFPLEARCALGRTALDLANGLGARYVYVAAAIRGEMIGRRLAHLERVAAHKREMVRQRRLSDDAFIASLKVRLWEIKGIVAATQAAVEVSDTNVALIQAILDKSPHGDIGAGPAVQLPHGGAGGGGSFSDATVGSIHDRRRRHR